MQNQQTNSTLRDGAAPLRGVNMSGADFGGGRLPGVAEIDYTYNSAASYEYFAAKGLNLIRVPILWERIQPVLNGPLDDFHLNGLKNNIAWAKQRGCRVVIDIHNYARYDINEGGVYTTYIMENVYDGEVKVNTRHLADLWVRLSDLFKDEPAIYAYGMMNEPHDMGTANWHAISQAVLMAIRDNGDNSLIMVPGDHWSGAGGWLKINGPDGWISDPANNFKYEAHQYFDHDNSGTYKWTYEQELAENPNLATVGPERLSVFTAWCEANGADGFIGEFGSSNSDPRWNDVLDHFMTAVDEAGFDWTYWAAGELWAGYPLSVQPSDNFTKDATQMGVLQKYAGR